MQFQMGLWALLFFAVILFFGQGSGSDVFINPAEGRRLFYLLGVGAMAVISGILGVYAHRSAPASTLAPLQYFRNRLGDDLRLVFGDFPDAIKWLGILIIMASGFYILWRERRFASKPVSDTSDATRAP